MGTMKDLRATKEELEDAIRQYNEDYKNKLIELLRENGLYETDVVLKDKGEVGRLVIERNSRYFTLQPFDIKFYKYTKSGRLSKLPSYFWISYDSDAIIIQDLNKKIALAGGK